MGQQVPLPSAADVADDLLDAVASFRRAARQVAPSPVGSFTGSQVELLALVRRQPGLSISHAAAALRLAVNTVSTLVGQLVEAQMLVREPDPADGRVARLRLTPAASRRIGMARERRVSAVAGAVDQLGRAERAQVTQAVRVLRRLAVDLAGPEEQARVGH